MTNANVEKKEKEQQKRGVNFNDVGKTRFARPIPRQASRPSYKGETIIGRYHRHHDWHSEEDF